MYFIGKQFNDSDRESNFENNFKKINFILMRKNLSA